MCCCSLLYLFDTGGGRLPEIVDKAQVDWYRNLSASLRQQQDPTKGPVPALAFFHIPLEHYDAIFSPTDKVCSFLTAHHTWFTPLPTMHANRTRTRLPHTHAHHHEGVLRCRG
jgi:hypothetical protein